MGKGDTRMITLTLALGWSPATALAAPGDHLRAGELEVVPDVDLGAEYRSNVYRQEEGGPGAGNLLLAPGVTAKLAGDDHAFDGSFDWRLRKFLFVGDGALENQPPGRVGNLDRFNEFSGAASLDAFKRNAVGFRLSERVALQNWTADAPFADLPYSSVFRNALNGAVRTGGQQTSVGLLVGGQWTFDSYLAPVVGEREGPINSRHAFGPKAELKWSFLPRTAVVVRGSYTLNRWQNNFLESDIDQPDGAVAVPDSEQLKVWSGLEGRITEKLFVEMSVGYGAAPYDPTSVPGTAGQADQIGASVVGARRFLAKGQVRYDIRPSTPGRPGTKVSAGYIRDFRDSFFTNWVGLDQVFVDFDGRIGPVLPSARYEVRFEEYFGELTRSDTLHRVTADVGYRLREYAKVAVGGWFHRRASSDAQVEYDDVNVHVFATFQY